MTKRLGTINPGLMAFMVYGLLNAPGETLQCRCELEPKPVDPDVARRADERITRAEVKRERRKKRNLKHA